MARACGEDVRRQDAGEAMVIWCLLLAVMLLPLAGLSVDLWHGIAVQRQLQAAAEDAALAGASGVDVAQYRGTGCVALSPPAALGLAEANLSSQQGLGPLSGKSVSVLRGGRQIMVWLQQQVHLTLLSLVEGDRPLIVSASAESGPKGSLSGRGCALGAQQ